MPAEPVRGRPRRRPGCCRRRAGRRSARPAARRARPSSSPTSRPRANVASRQHRQRQVALALLVPPLVDAPRVRLGAVQVVERGVARVLDDVHLHRPVEVGEEPRVQHHLVAGLLRERAHLGGVRGDRPALARTGPWSDRSSRRIAVPRRVRGRAPVPPPDGVLHQASRPYAGPRWPPPVRRPRGRGGRRGATVRRPGCPRRRRSGRRAGPRRRPRTRRRCRRRAPSGVSAACGATACSASFASLEPSLRQALARVGRGGRVAELAGRRAGPARPRGRARGRSPGDRRHRATRRPGARPRPPAVVRRRAPAAAGRPSAGRPTRPRPRCRCRRG